MSGSADLATVSIEQFHRADISQRQHLAQQVDEACRTLGFLVVVEHGVANKVIDDAWCSMREFFEQPLQQKLAVQSPYPGCPRGYFPLAAEALARSLGDETPPDRKESLSVGPWRVPEPIALLDREFHFGPNLWPQQPAGLQNAWQAYWQEMESLGAAVLRLFAHALALEEDYFIDRHSHPISALRGLRYTPTNEIDLLPGQFGAGAHSDYGSLTILKPDPDVVGLEIRLPNGEWAAAPMVQDGFLINIGDLMARWTNDRWVSTLHRVRAATDRPRHSLAFFHNTNVDCEIRCMPTCLAAGEQPRYEPVLAGEHLRQRFLATQGSDDFDTLSD